MHRLTTTILLHLKRLLLFLAEDIKRTDFFGLCAQMSFYMLMAFFPLLIFLLNFVGQYIVEFQDYLFSFLRYFLPEISYEYALNLIDSFKTTLNTNNYLLLLITFFFASQAARAIIVGMNQNYGNLETRSRPKVLFLSFLFTFLFAIALIVIITATIIGENLGQKILTYIGIDAWTIGIMRLISFIFALLIMFLSFSAVYILAPNKHIHFLSALPGAAFSTVGITVVFRVVLIFMNRSPKYTLLYGNTGGLFALLVGIYFICFILNLGGKINVYFSTM